jgi:prepilin-type N-terminal cleavage/methylation domain-containing protein
MKLSSNGFSLLELSIVLVIIGLLAGGVMVGQDLVRQAELRAITQDFQKFLTAINAFKNKYSALPGDMANATAYWGKDNAACTAHTGTAAVPGTCNGNGNSSISNSPVIGGTGEMFQFWKQLSLAGLVEGTYTGIGQSGGVEATLPGTNGPDSKITGAGWAALTTNGTINASTFNMIYGNYLLFGAATTNGLPINPILNPGEASSIDQKLDDGKPAYGKIIAAYWNNQCSAADNGTHANNNFEASYRLSDISLRCALIFRQLY